MNDEKHIIKELCNGSHEAFSRLFESYKKRIYGFLYNMLHSHEDVEDLLQLVFVKIWESRATMKHELSLDAYVFKIAKNSALNLLRQKTYRLLLEKQLIDTLKVSEDGEIPLIDNDLKRHLDLLIADIPERRREIFLLHYKQELTYKKIAEQLNISENTVDTQIRHARNYLRKQLGKELWAVTLPLITFASILSA